MRIFYIAILLDVMLLLGQEVHAQGGIGVEISPIELSKKKNTIPKPIKPSSESRNQCVQMVGNQWITQACPQGSDCGETNPSKYPWVVLSYKNGKYDGMNDYKTYQYAEQQKNFWQKFNNITWPKFSKTEYGQYRYIGPFRKCNTAVPKLTKNEFYDVVNPYLSQWRGKIKEAREIIAKDKNLPTFRTFKEYYKGLENAEKAVRRLENMITDRINPSLAYICENIADLYDAGIQMREAYAYIPRTLTNPPLDLYLPDIGKYEVLKRKVGLYEFGDRYSIKYKGGANFKLARIKITGNTTTLFLEATGGRVNQGNENEFYITDNNGYRYTLKAVSGISPNVMYNRAIVFSCVFHGRLNNISGPFKLIEGNNAPTNPNEGTNWWNIYNVTLK